MSPLIAFLIIFVLLLIALIKFKVTPSVGLFAAAVIFGLMVGMPAADVLSTLPAGFGNMMTSIGLLIVFGSIFGDFLGESGATEELAKGMVRLFGKKNDLLALNLVGFILSIPIYFGCAYVMTAPLVVALQKISRKNMKAYVIAIFTGLMLTHSCVAPTPGPLAVAGQAGANIGWFIIWGLVVCLPASLLIGWVYANFVASAEEKKAMHDGMKAIMDDDKLLAPDPTKPSAMKSFLLVILPIVMIVFASICIGILFRFYKAGPTARREERQSRPQFHAQRFTTAFTGSIKNSFLSTLNICAFVVFFTVVIQLLIRSGFLPGLAQVLGTVLAPFGLTPEWAQRLLTGALEISSGVWTLSGDGTLSGKLILAAFMLGWAGISVHCQVLSFIGGSGLSVGTYLVGKLLHGGLSALFIAVLVRLFPLEAPVSDYLADQVAGIAGMDFHRTLVISLVCAWVLFLFFLFVAAAAARKSLGKRHRSVL